MCSGSFSEERQSYKSYLEATRLIGCLTKLTLNRIAVFSHFQLAQATLLSAVHSGQGIVFYSDLFYSSQYAFMGRSTLTRYSPSDSL